MAFRARGLLVRLQWLSRSCSSMAILPARSTSLGERLAQRQLGVFGKFGLGRPAFVRRLCDESASSSFNVQDYEDFNDRVLQSEKPVVVQFHAEWCGPCRMLGPRLESIVEAKDGCILLARVNVDECADLAMEYGVQSIPTVIGFNNGSVVDKFSGVSDDDTIRNFVEKLNSHD